MKGWKRIGCGRIPAFVCRDSGRDGIVGQRAEEAVYCGDAMDVRVGGDR
ncbi:hypothetical protein RKD44_000844 [Streptomyces collinus]